MTQIEKFLNQPCGRIGQLNWFSAVTEVKKVARLFANKINTDNPHLFFRQIIH